MSSFISGEVFLRKTHLLNVFQLKEKSEVSVTLCEHLCVCVCVCQQPGGSEMPV